MQKGVVSLPLNGAENGRDTGRGRGESMSGPLSGLYSGEEETHVESNDKVKDIITAEIRKVRDEILRLNLSVDQKIRNKLDKSDIEEVESKLFVIMIINLEKLLEIIIHDLEGRMKKYVDKVDQKKLRTIIEK